MANITSCTRCATAYEAASEEDANAPDRLCPSCLARAIKGVGAIAPPGRRQHERWTGEHEGVAIDDHAGQRRVLEARLVETIDDVNADLIGDAFLRGYEQGVRDARQRPKSTITTLVDEVKRIVDERKAERARARARR